jgi:hypothetical protein
MQADILRILPIICQFGIGAILCVVGIWCGLKGGYLDLKIPEDRRLLFTLIGGFLFMLLLACFFTFFAPFWADGGMP